MKSAPKISVLIPNYNYGQYLPETIASVLEQDFRDFEIVIVDNCSPDGSQETIRRFAATDDRIRFQFNESNLGMVANFNRCLSLARGEYVQLLLSDDKLATRDALGKMSRMLDDHPSAALAVCARALIDAKSEQIGSVDVLGDDGVHQGLDIILKCLEANRNLIGEPTAVMLRRSCLTRDFNPEFQHLVDLEMWLHLLEKGDLVYTREPLCAFRQHAAQQSALNTRSRIIDREHALLLAKYCAAPWFTAQKRRAILFPEIYKLRRKGGPFAGADAVAAGMLKSLGRAQYAWLWLLYKIKSPFDNLKASYLKRVRPVGSRR